MQQKDHTYEVEKRVTAIPINTRDSCSFFEVRENSLAPRKECYFCAFGKFNDEIIEANTKGFCKFKK